jgi:hypothetical protein
MEERMTKVHFCKTVADTHAICGAPADDEVGLVFGAFKLWNAWPNDDRCKNCIRMVAVLEQQKEAETNGNNQ